MSDIFVATSLVTDSGGMSASGVGLAASSLRLDGAQFRVMGRSDKLNHRGQPFTRLELGNVRGCAITDIPHAYFLPCHRNVDHGDIVSIVGEMLEVADQWVIRTESVYVPPRQRVRATALLPKAWALAPFHSHLRTVIRAWARIGHPALRLFLSEAFLDPSTALGFLNAPASQRFHHAYQGGLLEHSADMIERLNSRSLSAYNGIQRDLATVLILIHDIGKTVTLVGQGRSERGAYQPHELAALEILACALAQLEMTDSALANSIRGFFKPREWYPKQYDRVYRLVSALDRSSASYAAKCVAIESPAKSRTSLLGGA